MQEKLEKIKRFLELAKEMEEKITVSFERYKSIKLFDTQPHFIRLQEEMREKAQEVGVILIDKALDGSLEVLVDDETFQKMNLENIEEYESVDYKDESAKWIHYKAHKDGIVLLACRKKEDVNVQVR